MLFGKKRPEEETVLLLDIESGSVGVALARLGEARGPKLFGEKRFHIPVRSSRDHGSIARIVGDAARKALGYISEVAARVRMHPAAGAAGKVSQARIFLAAPWGVPNFLQARPDFFEPLAHDLRQGVAAHFDALPLAFHTAGSAVINGLAALYPYESAYLAVAAHGELSELFLVNDGLVIGHATIPLGRHVLLRTLMTHGGLTAAEAQSALRLEPDALRDAIATGGAHYAEQVTDAARELITAPVRAVFVVAPEPAGNHLARALAAHEPLTNYFPEGGVVRALRAHHAAPLVAAHAEDPDMHLLLAAVFADAHRSI